MRFASKPIIEYKDVNLYMCDTYELCHGPKLSEFIEILQKAGAVLDNDLDKVKIVIEMDDSYPEPEIGIYLKRPATQEEIDAKDKEIRNSREKDLRRQYEELKKKFEQHED